MRHFYCCLIFHFGLLAQIAAQPVLSIETQPISGSAIYNGWTPATFFAPGGAGANQTWDFNTSGLSIPIEVYRDFMPAQGTQFAAQYPNATRCMRTSAGFGPSSFNYYSLTDSTVSDWGLAVPGGTRIRHLQPWVKKFPLVYDSTYTGTFTGTRIFNNGQTSHFTTTFEIKYDAFGTLALPLFSPKPNTMRVKTILTERDSLPLANNTYNITLGVQEYYNWYAPNQPGHLCWTSKYSGSRINFSANGDTLQITQLAPLNVMEMLHPASSSHTNEPPHGAMPSFSIQGNPTTDWLHLQLLDAEDAFLEVAVGDLDGRLIQQWQPTLPGQSFLSIQVSELKRGQYWVSVRSKKGLHSRSWQKH